MKFFAVISRMLDVDKNNSLRDKHLEYLKKLEKEGKVFSKGRFIDGTGGLVIYKADSQEDVKNVVEGDPFVLGGARSYEIHEWAMQLNG